MDTLSSPTKGEQTRALILSAAHRLFLEHGYHGTSVRQIAAEAGVALGGIYNHFPSKEAIFESVFSAHHPYNQIIPAVQQARGDTLEIFLRDIASSIIAGLNNNPGFLNLLFIDLVELQNRYTAQLVEQQLPFFQLILERLIQLAGPRLRPIPPLLIGRSFFGLFFSYYITANLLQTVPNWPHDLTDDKAFEHFLDIFMHGILVDRQEGAG